MEQVFLNMKPNWASVVSNKAGLIEVEINDEDPGFHSIIEELSTEIEPGIVGVKASDFCLTRKAEGRRQEAEGILFSPSACDQREHGSESPTIISDLVAKNWAGLKPRSNSSLLPSAFCLLPPAFFTVQHRDD